MGHLQAMEMARLMPDMETAMRWHLQYNHYPPHPEFMVDVAMKAIQLAGNERWDEEVQLPHGVEFRGRNYATVSEIVESLHLDAFIEQSEE